MLARTEISTEKDFEDGQVAIKRQQKDRADPQPPHVPGAPVCRDAPEEQDPERNRSAEKHGPEKAVHAQGPDEGAGESPHKKREGDGPSRDPVAPHERGRLSTTDAVSVLVPQVLEVERREDDGALDREPVIAGGIQGVSAMAAGD